MNAKDKLLTSNLMNALAERLGRISAVKRFDQPGEPQGATLAHSLSDLEESFRTMLDTLFPKLLDDSLTPEQLNDVLLDIGEEFRHVLYHIRDPKFFGYLFEA